MPVFRYMTNDVPQWGTAAFSPVFKPTPLASTGGEQTRLLQQWTDAEDPNLAGMASTAPRNLSFQPSYAQIGTSPDFGVDIDATYVPGLPLAFRPVVNARHFMAYSTTPQDGAGKQSMGPNGYNTHLKIWSDNPLPIPAQNPGRVAKAAMRTQPAGTPIATAWPRPFISWPTWGSSRQA
jgi:hypothetical protein